MEHGVDAAAELLHLLEVRDVAGDDLPKPGDLLVIVAVTEHQAQLVTAAILLREVAPDVAGGARHEHEPVG